MCENKGEALRGATIFVTVFGRSIIPRRTATTAGRCLVNREGWVITISGSQPCIRRVSRIQRGERPSSFVKHAIGGGVASRGSRTWKPYHGAFARKANAAVVDTYGGTPEFDTRSETRRGGAGRGERRGFSIGTWAAKVSRFGTWNRRVVNEHRLLPGRYFAGFYLFGRRKEGEPRRKKTRLLLYYFSSFSVSRSFEGFSTPCSRSNQRTHQRINPMSTLW